MLNSASITYLGNAFADKTLSPVEVLDAQLARIRRRNPDINAFVLLDEEGARKAADASEARWQRGEPLGPLDGITFTAKDNLPVAGYPSRRGSLVTTDSCMKESAPIVARCLEAGAVFLGTTTLPEFAMGPITVSPFTGVTRNPRNMTRHAGGSSGGAAASVAAGFCTFSAATDAGGSIRIPAALCGVTGFKPSGGRVPTFPPSVVGTLSCHGPIAQSAEDTALVLNAVTRSDARDPMTTCDTAADYAAALQGGVKGWKVALSLTLGFAKRVHPEIEAAVRAAARVLENLGAIVEECDPEVEDPVNSYLVLLRGGARHGLRELLPEQRALLSPDARDILDGPEIALTDYLKAQEHCLSLARRMHVFHERYDILVTPTVAWPAFPAERDWPEEFDADPNRRAWTPFTSLFNLTQQPAISVPAGLTEEGMPIGLHIAAARGSDAAVLRAAAAYQNRN